MYPSNHKTVFVLDHTPYFGISSEDPIEIGLANVRGPGYILPAVITKTLWTCSVEVAVEYCRIIWDIFPEGKLIRFVVSDSEAHTLNSWSPHLQNTQHLLKNLAMLGCPSPINAVGVFSVLHGLIAAIEALTEYSDVQHERRTSLKENASRILNKCRVICITATLDNAGMESLEKIFLNQLVKQNLKAFGSDKLIPVDHCHLVIINVFPNNTESLVTGHPPRDISPILMTEVHLVPAGGGISVKLSNLMLRHYDLASTTVTGIPMKEEQNASSSANYDVEIYHPAAVHVSILKGNAADSALNRRQREGAEYETMTLKWGMSRGDSASEMQNCTQVHRVTPVDVTSLPSSCLFDFLLNGRSVKLEMPCKAGGKLVTHLLAAHGGEIFIHSLVTARSIVEKPPSITEGCGGRVRDYRIADFGEFMRNNKVMPLRVESHKTELPLEMMRLRLDRQTKSWPLTTSSTFIFNLKTYMEPLLTHMMKKELTMEEVVQCKQVIYRLVILENKLEPLPIPNMVQRGLRREEHYCTMWAELEGFVRAHCRTETHAQVLGCLLECLNKTDETKGGGKAVNPGEKKVELNHASVESELVGGPPSLRVAHTPSASIYSGSRSLLDVFKSRQSMELKARREARPEFQGILNAELTATGTLITKLYAHMEGGNDPPRRGEPNTGADG